MRRFLKTGRDLLPVAAVLRADYSEIEDCRLKVLTRHGEFEIEGIDALEGAMLLNPACLEGKRLRWPKHVWAFHNLVGHPLMQLLAFARLYRWAFWVHDRTVPRPRGVR